MRLTLHMLDAMLTALVELEAAGEPQGYPDDASRQVVMDNCVRAQAWIRQEFARRKRQIAKRQARAEADRA